MSKSDCLVRSETQATRGASYFKMLFRPANVLAFCLLLLTLASCVPNRKVMFLQKGDVNKKNLPTDTVLRTYSVKIDEYRIQPLDLLSIRIESLTGEEFDFFAKLYPMNQGSTGGGTNTNAISFLVDPVGNVTFPVVGTVTVAGLSVFQAESKLEEAFSAYLKNPVARVRLLNFRVTILGEVLEEQQVVSSNTRLTVMEAIGLAGGLTDLADRSAVKVVRQKGAESSVYYVNLLDESFLASDYYYVQQNDIIVVPPLKQRNFRKYFGQNLALVLSSISVILVTINLILLTQNQ